MPLTKTTVSVSDPKGSGIAGGPPINPPFLNINKLPTNGSIVHMNWDGTALVTTHAGPLYAYGSSMLSIYSSTLPSGQWVLEYTEIRLRNPNVINSAKQNFNCQINESGNLAFFTDTQQGSNIDSSIIVYQKNAGVWSLYKTISFPKRVVHMCIANNGNTIFTASYDETKTFPNGADSFIEEYTFDGLTWVKTNQITLPTNSTIFTSNNAPLNVIKSNITGDKLIFAASGETIAGGGFLCTKINNQWNVSKISPPFNNDSSFRWAVNCGIDKTGNKTIVANKDSPSIAQYFANQIGSTGPLVTGPSYSMSGRGTVQSSFGTFMANPTTTIITGPGSTAPVLPPLRQFGSSVYISNDNYMYTYYNATNYGNEVKMKDFTITNPSILYPSTPNNLQFGQGFGHSLSCNEYGKRLAITNIYGETFVIDRP